MGCKTNKQKTHNMNRVWWTIISAIKTTGEPRDEIIVWSENRKVFSLCSMHFHHGEYQGNLSARYSFLTKLFTPKILQLCSEQKLQSGKVACICEHEQGLERKHLGHTLHFWDCFCFLSYDSFSGKKWPFCESRGKGNCPATCVIGLEEAVGQASGAGGDSRTEIVSEQIAGRGTKWWVRSYYRVASPTWTTEITKACTF